MCKAGSGDLSRWDGRMGDGRWRRVIGAAVLLKIRTVETI
jgi:hypothetical protein